jgi:E3 ubiquitin-protein ligase TRIP12
MDLPPIQHQEATSSSLASTAQPNQDSTRVSTSETKTIRSSARVKAAKQKAKQSVQDNDRDSSNPEQAQGTSTVPQLESISTRTSRSSPVKANRSRELSAGKGKAKEVPAESSRSNKRYAAR